MKYKLSRYNTYINIEQYKYIFNYIHIWRICYGRNFREKG